MESKHPDQVPTTYRCDHCDIGYPRQVELRDHMFRVHGERIKFDAIKLKRESFSCRVCQAPFENKDLWMNHQVDEHYKYSCSQCDHENEDKDSFLEHLTSHSEAKSFKCPVCHHSFSSERGFETHLSVVHNMTKDEMPDPEIEYGEQDGIPVECAVDIQINGDEEDEDDDLNDDLNDLNNVDGNGEHDESLPAKRIKLDTANSSTPVNQSQLSTTCRICKETFANRPALILHMRSSHSSVNRTMPSLTASPNVTPIQTHNVNNRLRCRICQKRIHTKNGYKRHMLTVHQVKVIKFTHLLNNSFYLLVLKKIKYELQL